MENTELSHIITCLIFFLANVHQFLRFTFLIRCIYCRLFYSHCKSVEQSNKTIVAPNSLFSTLINEYHQLFYNFPKSEFFEVAIKF